MKSLVSALVVLCVLTAPISLWAGESIVQEMEGEGTGKVLPRIVYHPSPELPPSLARAAADGSVVVTFTVREDGTVTDVSVASSPHRQLNSYALKAVRSWRFEPGTRDGLPATFKMRAPVGFGSPPAVAPSSTNNQAPAPGITPVARRKAPVIYPYEVVISGQPAWADASFVVDYSGRPLFTNSTAASNKAFAKAVVAMIEASEYQPVKNGALRAMTLAQEHYQYDGELSLDPEARRILNELRKPTSSIIDAATLTDRPKVIRQVSPAYPRALKDDGLTGQAEIEFIVSREGHVHFPRIVSATHEDFGWAASVAVSQWLFQPPTKDGQTVEIRMTVPVLFTAQKLAEAE